jgi:hypothetical protein
MTTEYNNEVYMNPVPTGFGSYTGVSIFNRSAKSVTYVAEMSETVLYKAGDVLLPEAEAANQNLYNTLFVSSDLTDVNTSLNETVLTLGAGESGNIYIAHKPFNTFSSSAVASTGIETATLNIVSESSAGDADALINIEITGQRILDPLSPDKPGRFFAIESYDRTNKYALNFNWKLLSGQSFVTGFKLDLCSDSSFTTPVKDSPYEIPIAKNSEFSEPDYLSYYNYGTIDFSYKVNELPTDGDLYSRIFAVNGLDANSDATFCTGFKSNILPFIDDVTYSGLHPTPGDNLGFGTDFLLIDYVVDNNEVDLTTVLYENNGDSYDFTHYTGVVINFISSDANGIFSSKKDVAAIRLKKPENGSFSYSVNSSNKFNLVLNFDDVFVAGYNGRGANGNVAGENGSAIFDFDNLNYGNKVFDYYINKDKASVFYAGLGGEQSLKNNSNPATNVTEGTKLDHSNLSNLDSVNRRKLDGREQEFKAAGSDGKLIKESPSSFPNLYLGFSQKDASSSIPNSKLLFRFQTENMGGAAGDAVTSWSSSSGVGKPLSFKNTAGDNTSLTVREAYGRKFYELKGAVDQGKAIKAVTAGNSNPSFGVDANGVDLRPNYTILVFALARKNLINDNYDETITDMLSKCGAIHKFVDETRWGIGNSDLSEGFWGQQNAPFDPNELVYNFYRKDGITKSSFVGSSLNSPAFVQPGSNAQLYNEKEAQVNERLFFNYSNQQELDDQKWKETITTASDRAVANHINYKNLNLAKTLSLGSSSQLFSVSGDDLQAFELFFVKMHSTLVDSKPEFVDLKNDFVQGLQNETFINDRRIFDHTLALQKDKTAKKMLIQLNNNDSNAGDDTRTRLYLFDYLYGAAETVDERDSDSESIMQYLSSYYAPLILKSSSAKLIARNNASSNQQLAFDLPLSHNYLDLYSS